ncbi:GNAT family N-acetyltransferase [Fulvivirga lutimaris]|uniref:GNAT family N-acetyltransferase n=1 Tax=Fulvivirga lutimaris TaxID=1819566 RepID=UPI0012BBD421|nr:GNAT family N-acetyltransferase [Fulvivirga lutimaris]MTI39865.1 GNAT family N-acetyltransferase [Fulvivirga lutimaris]
MTNNTIHIFQATEEHLNILVDLGRTTFVQTYAKDNSVDNMIDYLDAHFNLKQIKSELRNSNSFFYLAEKDNEYVGFLKLNTGDAQTEETETTAFEVERIYVLKKFQGQRIGKLFMDKAIEVAEAHHAPFVWLGVWEENPNAIAFYKKCGFNPFGTHTFTIGDDDQTDIMMKLEI